MNMLGLAKRVGARFLLTSTSEVYGDPLQHPQVETYWGNVNPIGNISSSSLCFIWLSQIWSTLISGSFNRTVLRGVLIRDALAGDISISLI